MSSHYDIDDILYLAQRGISAAAIQEDLGLRISVRQVQRLISSRLGHRPSKLAVSRPDPLRAAVMAYMETQGFDRRVCNVCFKHKREPCMIRCVSREPSLGSFIFVCRKDSVAGDF